VKERLYDVVIYNTESRKIVSIVGKSMRMTGGTHNAERRLETARDRCNDRHDAEIVFTGVYKEGDSI
jgi:hypothetical protein